MKSTSGQLSLNNYFFHCSLGLYTWSTAASSGPPAQEGQQSVRARKSMFEHLFWQERPRELRLFIAVVKPGEQQAPRRSNFTLSVYKGGL